MKNTEIKNIKQVKLMNKINKVLGGVNKEVERVNTLLRRIKKPVIGTIDPPKNAVTTSKIEK